MDARLKTVAVTGPTASGKTALAIAIAKHFDGEIISCDSMQIYRGMDIGTAKATAEERQAVPHHMIDILDPTQPFSAAEYGERAEKIAFSIAKRGKLPVFCGGTGLYLEAVRTARHESNTAVGKDEERMRLQRLAEEKGNEYLHAQLAKVDPDAAAAIHPNNLRRVIRALEIFYTTGVTKTETDRLASKENPRLSLLNLTLLWQDRTALYERIDRRVDAMLQMGLLEETRRLYTEGKLIEGTTSAAAIGYKECLGVIQGEMTREKAAEILKNATHHYAKRQETWFRQKPHIPLFADGKTPAALLAEATAEIRKYLNQ